MKMAYRKPNPYAADTPSLLNRLERAEPTIEDGRGRRPIPPVPADPPTPQPRYVPPWRQSRTEQEAELIALEAAYQEATAIGGQMRADLGVLANRVESGRAKIAQVNAATGDVPPAWWALLDKLELEYADLSVKETFQTAICNHAFVSFDIALRNYERRQDIDQALEQRAGGAS